MGNPFSVQPTQSTRSSYVYNPYVHRTRYIDRSDQCQAITLRHNQCTKRAKETYSLCGIHVNYIKRHLIQAIYDLKTMKKFNKDLFNIILKYY